MTDNSIQDVTTSVTWSSSDTTKATITTGGLATGVVAGYTTIKATPSVGTAGSTLLTVVSLTPSIALAYPLDSSDSRLAEATVGSDGTLLAVPGSPLNGISGVTIAAHPNGTNLYLGNNTATISGYTSSIVNISVDKSTGKLTFPSYSDAPAGFVYSLVTNPNGKFLHGIEMNTASSILLETLTLDSTTGRPSGAAHTFYILNSTYSGSIRATFNSSGSIMYVAGQDYVPGHVPPLETPRIYVFQVDATTGALTLLQNLSLSLVVNGGMSLDSTGKFLLAGVKDPNTSASSIQVFSIDGSGQLSPASTYGTYTASGVAIHGANGYVFAAGVGLGSGNAGLAVFSLDGTGHLGQLATIAIPATVNDMHVSNDGRYVTVLLNNQLSTYSFDSTAGTLTPVNTLATGGGNFNQMAYIPLN
jgi:6-phosphogluconolactonase (cycloisomerase 2 family)